MKFFLKFVTLALIVFIAYQSRWMFSFKYEPEYYENFYYESQYTYPSSARGISDGSLYKFVGYRLTQGENPFNINWEIPPLGKALYGYSSRFFGNPYWFSVFSFFASLIVFFIFLSKYFKKSVIPVIGLIMLILIPHFSNQISDTMLDLPLTLAYMVHILFFFRYLDAKEIKDLTLAGLFLGLASAIKPPLYVPFILISELFITYFNEKKIGSLMILPVFTLAGYVLGYFVYFIRHPNPFPWLRLHGKIFSFYLGPKLNVAPLAAIREIFNLGTWGIFYIVGLVCYFVAWFKYIKEKRNLKLLTLLLFSTVFLVVSSLIPFFPRYLLPLSFVFIFLVLDVFKNKPVALLLICVLSFPFFYKSFKLPIPDGDALAAARFIETRADRELYRSINPVMTKEIPESVFINTIENFNAELGTRKIQVIVGERSKVQDRYYYNFKIRYFTRFGVVDNNVPFEYEDVNGQWKLDWSWNYLYGKFTPGSKIQFVNIPGKVTKVYEVYVIPRLMYDWKKGLNYLSYLTGITTVDINNNLTTVVPNDFEKFVGYLSSNVPVGERENLIKDRGMVRVKGVFLNSDFEDKTNSLKIN